MDIVYSVAASLDGFIATPDGGVDWLPPVGEGEDFGLGAFIAGVDALVMGRETYEVTRRLGPWPYAQPAVVLTRTPLADPPAGVVASAAGPADTLARLRADGCRRVWLVGGGRMAASCLSAGLVTHVDVAVVPVLLGGGVPLVATLAAPTRLRLVGQRAVGSVVLLQYRLDTSPA